MADRKGTRELTTASQAGLVDFLRTDLSVCSTFLDVAKMEAATDRPHSLEAPKRAVRACEIIESLFNRVHDATDRQEIRLELNLLQSRLAIFKSEAGFGLM
jgi:hypothetical protein